LQWVFGVRCAVGVRALVKSCMRASMRASVWHACDSCKRCRCGEAGPEVLTVLNLRERAGGTLATTSDPPEQQHEQRARCRRRAPSHLRARRAYSDKMPD
jgi:hypothetical protein